MNIGSTVLLIAAVVLFAYEAWRGRSLVALGLACFAAAFVLTIAIAAR